MISIAILSVVLIIIVTTTTAVEIVRVAIEMICDGEIIIGSLVLITAILLMIPAFIVVKIAGWVIFFFVLSGCTAMDIKLRTSY